MQIASEESKTAELECKLDVIGSEYDRATERIKGLEGSVATLNSTIKTKEDEVSDLKKVCMVRYACGDLQKCVLVFLVSFNDSSFSDETLCGLKMHAFLFRYLTLGLMSYSNVTSMHSWLDG